MENYYIPALRLFRSVVVPDIGGKVSKEKFEEVAEKTVKRGYIFSPEVLAHYYDHVDKIVEAVETLYGMSAEKLNASFHKSWKKVRDTNLEDLIVQQLAHYLTTYGKESPGAYVEEKEWQWNVENLAEKIVSLDDFESDKLLDRDYVYIPSEELKIPELGVGGIVKLVIIRGLTKEVICEKLVTFLSTGIALKEQTVKDVLTVAEMVGFEEIEKVKNKEVRCALSSKLEIVPRDPVEFLRVALYVATGSTLIIKSSDLMERIRNTEKGKEVRAIFDKYIWKYELSYLASIFYRFKPLFLAFRYIDKDLRRTINIIRRQAPKYHKPMKVDYLNTITEKLQQQKPVCKKEMEEALERVNIFRKIRLAYALKFRMAEPESVLYRIRNGSAWATGCKVREGTSYELYKTFSVVRDSIVHDLLKATKEKRIFIPDYINYALPATEKQFTGNLPSGTFIEVKSEDLIVGVHWENVKRDKKMTSDEVVADAIWGSEGDKDSRRIDLDFSIITADRGKIGWDARYSTKDQDILFSGDLTDAKKPKGATELFYIRRQPAKTMLFNLNYFNYTAGVEVPYKIFVASEKVAMLGENYMVNPNNVILSVSSMINKKQQIVGLLIPGEEICRFYFIETNIGVSVTAVDSEISQHARQYLVDYYKNTIGLRELLVDAGAVLVEDKEDAELDLSPEALEKDTIINLVKGENG